MRTTGCNITVFVLALAVIAIAPAPVAAGVSGRIVYAQGDSLWLLPASGDGEPVELATLPPGVGSVRRLAASRDGATLLVVAENRVLWLEMGASTPATVHPLDCGRPAYLSMSGRRIACSDGSGNAVVHDLRPRARTRTIKTGGSLLGFLDRSATTLGVGDARGIWQVPLLTPARRTRVSPDRPPGAIRVSPDGDRAAAVYPDAGRANEGRRDESAPAAYTFRLDGKATRRRLMADGTPVSWSANGRWVLVQRTREACMVRAVGGQFKCWRGYRGIGFSPDADYALLSRKSSDAPDDAPPGLYRATRDGVHADHPRLLRDKAGRAAVWLPARP